jgi:hypothetical protein
MVLRSAVVGRSPATRSAARGVAVGLSPVGWRLVFDQLPLSYFCQVPFWLRYTLPSRPA